MTELLSAREAAEYMTQRGVKKNRWGIYYLVENQSLKTHKIGARHYFKRSELDVFLGLSEQPPAHKIQDKAKANETLSRHNITPSGQRVSPTSTSSNASGRISGGSSPSTAAHKSTAKRKG